MELTTKTPKEVALAIQSYFSEKGMTIAEAAREIDRTPQALYNSLRGEHRIGIKMATALNRRYGFSLTFMTRGIGELVAPRKDSDGLAEETKYRWGVYFDDSSDFTNRERMLNQMARVLSETFFSLNNRLKCGMRLDLFDYQTPSELGIHPTSGVEESLITTICQYSSMIRQVTDPNKLFDALGKLDLDAFPD